MKEVIITIEESDIKARIFTESGYAALARAKAGVPAEYSDMLQATEDEQHMLKAFIAESVNEAAGIISRYMTPCSARSGDSALIYITFKLPYNTPEGIENGLKEVIKSFVVSRSMQHWAQTVKPDEMSLHSAKAQNCAVQIREMLCRRTRPAKQDDTKDNIVEL